MEDRTFVVIDNEGKEKEMVIMFTYTDEDSNKNYVFYTDPQDANQEVFVSAYDEEGNLYAVESDEEWEKLEEVFAEYQNEEHDHECCHHEDHDHECCHHEHGEGCCCHHEEDEEDHCCCEDGCDCHKEEN